MALLLPPPKSRQDRFSNWLYENMVKRPVSDAKWSLTHPSDRIHGYGRASQQSMEIPFFGFKNPYPQRIESSLPGHFLERVKYGEQMATHEGKLEARRRLPKSKGTANAAYNLKNEKGEIVGSVSMDTGKTDNYIPDIWVHSSLRKTRAFNDFGKLMLAAGRKPHGMIINPKLERIAKKLEERGKLTPGASEGIDLARAVEIFNRQNSARLAQRQTIPPVERASHIQQPRTEPLQVLDQLRRARGPVQTHVSDQTLRVATHAQPGGLRPQAAVSHEHLEALRARAQSPRRVVSPRDIVNRLRNYGGR